MFCPMKQAQKQRRLRTSYCPRHTLNAGLITARPGVGPWSVLADEQDPKHQDPPVRFLFLLAILAEKPELKQVIDT